MSRLYGRGRVCVKVKWEGRVYTCRVETLIIMFDRSARHEVAEVLSIRVATDFGLKNK